jgi:hypothetical protein
MQNEHAEALLIPDTVAAACKASAEPRLATSKPWVVCGISRAQWFKLAASGRTPLPSARLGTRRPVFLLEELRSWLEAGAPDRATWQKLKNESGDGRR